MSASIRLASDVSPDPSARRCASCGADVSSAWCIQSGDQYSCMDCVSPVVYSEVVNGYRVKYRRGFQVKLFGGLD